jgi:PAS domain S-box-containing protein
MAINLKRKKAEELLREQSLAINSAPDAIFSTDASFTIKSWNKTAQSMFGWTAKEAIGKVTTDIFNPVSPTLNRINREETITQLMKRGFWKGEVVYHKKDGSLIPVSVSARLVKDKGSKVSGMVAVVHDLTRRMRRIKALREIQRDLNRAQAVAKTGSWRLDTQRNVLLWSDENHRIFGVHKGKPMTYETFLSLIHPEDRAYVDRKWKAGLLGEPYDIDHRILVDGKVKWVRERAELEFYDNGKLRGGFGTTQDITDLVEIRQKLADAYVKLEVYANQMGALAEERAEKLRDAERLAAIGAPAGMVGHDIRNPLQAIVGDLYLVRSDLVSMAESREKENIKESLTAIEKNVEYINKIVQDLQDFAKPLNPVVREVDLKALCEDLLYKNDAPENINASCRVEEEARNVFTDPALLQRILSNLITNGFQAMPEGGKLLIDAYRDGDDVVISVQDTGTGISEENKAKLFMPLFTTKSKGQGFGLAVVKRMTEALGGTVTLESEEEKGTKFTIHLPVAKE